MTTLSINHLRLYCHHGVFSQERAVGAYYSVSVSLSYPDCPGPEADDLATAIDYSQIITQVRAVMQQPVNLIETAAHAIRSRLIELYPQVAAGQVTVTKELPPISGVELQSVSVTLSWPDP